MKTKIGINGFGRMGRLALRAAFDWQSFEFIHINEPGGTPEWGAHLLNYDTIHGPWKYVAECGEQKIKIGDTDISYSQNEKIGDTDWGGRGVDIVLECSGKFKTVESLKSYFNQGVKKVVVAAPLKEGAMNIVMGINDHLYKHEEHHLVTAASCTTNCLAPVIQVMKDHFTIRHAAVTTIHDITNTQSIIDQTHKDLRRARSSALSLIPTSSGSAKAIIQIFPELAGKIFSSAIRVPVQNASLIDCVFEVEEETRAKQVNQFFKEAALGKLKGILGYEEKPLVSIDYVNNIRSSILDAPLTEVIDRKMVKLIAWYDNEIGYVNRMMELARKISEEL